ncbi:MAG: NYN domain-containing protein [Deltaproteobacteria bacterium]|nr:NYN domain-containing protein [Deltaproteobacteria bacterium]
MASHWIIDAYNFIRQSPYLSNIEVHQEERAKEELFQFLNDFAEITQEKIIVVFDAYSGTHSEPIKKIKGYLSIIESRGSYTADEEIIMLAQSLREAAIVISSDREVMRGASKAGASILSSSEFEREVDKILDLYEAISEDPDRFSGLPPKRTQVPKEKKKAYRLLRKYQDPKFFL